ncbi:transcriptional regulator [Chryseobacterium lactis]|uniref:Ferric uptake regulator family n=3 Tax=Bacteroidota TaxID=976 RepID=A0A4U9VGA3_9SPHI|nr:MULTISPECIES: transcriptional repressor [Bacteroidota]OJV55606.1 MAG: transcriptional regulator [Bacteroidetes bacterium 43-16]AZA84038.1 transcriptional repressor [Chryseobacterium lactis]AZB04424.1 transcriptional repressor [Chryseobacterium lactis]MCT3745559.1 transcriptional repressor [Elizabethkingia anophelis]MDC8027088.1 transcriptional repressor [Elizabethkingia anophelis]
MNRRNTPSKHAVLDLLVSAGKALSREAIEQKIDVEIDRATIYRVLNRFCEDGLAHRIVAEDGKQYFAARMKFDENKFTDNHFHFQCSKCQTIECLAMPVNLPLDAGYRIESVNCILMGTCKDCSL